MDAKTQQELMRCYEQVKAAQAELNALLQRTTDRARDVGGFVFATPDGEVALRDLFGVQDDLIVVHNMGAGCSYFFAFLSFFSCSDSPSPPGPPRLAP